MTKDTFIFYSKWCDAIKELSPAVRLEIYEAISVYVCTGITPELSAEARAAFGFIRLDIDKDTVRYDTIVDARRQAGAKGGNCKQKKAKQATATKSKQKQANDTNSPPVYGSDSDSDSISSPTNVVEDDTTPSTTVVVSPPSLSQMVEYFKLKGYSRETAEKAFNYYTELGWHDSRGQPIKNWKLKCVSVWFKPESKQPETSNRPWGYDIAL